MGIRGSFGVQKLSFVRTGPKRPEPVPHKVSLNNVLEVTTYAVCGFAFSCWMTDCIYMENTVNHVTSGCSS